MASNNIFLSELNKSELINSTDTYFNLFHFVLGSWVRLYSFYHLLSIKKQFKVYIVLLKK